MSPAGPYAEAWVVGLSRYGQSLNQGHGGSSGGSRVLRKKMTYVKILPESFHQLSLINTPEVLARNVAINNNDNGATSSEAHELKYTRMWY